MANDARYIPEQRRQQVIRADTLARMAHELNRVKSIRGGRGINVQQTPHGTIVELANDGTGTTVPGIWVRVSEWNTVENDYTLIPMSIRDTAQLVDVVNPSNLYGRTTIEKPTLAIGARVFARQGGTDVNGRRRMLLDAPTYFQPFIVSMTQTGGAAGNASTQCSFTYTVQDASGTISLGTLVDPTSGNHLWNRPTVGAMIAADRGMAYYDTAGNLVIFLINEQVDTESCA